MKPATAAFETTPESSAATSGGACVYAPRSQPWKRQQRRLDGEGGDEAEEDPVVRDLACLLRG